MERDLLAGRTALVTGGSGGIGRALALQLAAEGTAVALGFRTSRESAEQLATEIAEQGRPIVATEADLSKPEAPVELAEGVEFALGPIDILVANAGVGRVASYEEVDGAVRRDARGEPTRALPSREARAAEDPRARIWSHRLHLVRRRLRRGIV